MLIVKGFLMQSTLLLWESRWPMGSQHLPHVEFLGLQLFRLRHNWSSRRKIRKKMDYVRFRKASLYDYEKETY